MTTTAEPTFTTPALDGLESPLRASGLGEQDPMFYVPGATAGTVQWKAETFQLVNWGGFEGRVVFNFHPGSTLISGASGTGKSTLLDAYIALMMPSDTPFNGASNDLVGGRARSAEQRNLLSYLRGQTDTTTDTAGREKAMVLRGDRTAAWGAVGMTFVNDHGRRFTALRAYYVPGSATRSTDIAMRMVTVDGQLDLADLAKTVEARFAPKVLKDTFPGLRTYDTYAAFANTLHTRLGIGANGDGEKALRLLVCIQSGHQIRTVDELYKEMVLERPRTYTDADVAIAHFNELEQNYADMKAAQQRVELLDPITARHDALLKARAEVETIDTFGLTRPGDTPIVLWSLRTEQALLDDAVETNRLDRARVGEELRLTHTKESSLGEELRTAREDHRSSGGADLERLASQIEQENVREQERAARRAVLAEKTTALAVPLGTRADFEALQTAAVGFLAGFDAADAELGTRRDSLLRKQYPLQDRKRSLKEERVSLSGRAGRVPKYLDDLRQQVATAVGMAPTDLPFVAELIDVAPDEVRWRTAIETVLAGSARRMLVPSDELARFRAAIDPLHLRGRITYEGVPRAPHHDVPGDPDKVAGKLLFKDSPYSTWVRRHVSDPARNALCVDTARELAGDGLRVTLAGQQGHGSRGSHGRGESSNIIGFSSAEAIEELDAALAAVEGQLDEVGGQRLRLDTERADLHRRKSAYDAAQTFSWDDIDVGGVRDRIRELEQARATILAADDRLRALEAHITVLDGRLEQVRDERVGLQRDKKDLDGAHGDLATRQDGVNLEVERVEDDNVVVLDDAAATRLDAEFAAACHPGDPTNLSEFAINLGRLHQRLSTAVDGAREEVRRAQEDLERIFTAYQLKWEDPNLGRTAASYPDYAAVLDGLRTAGLYEQRQRCKAILAEWTGEDLVSLHRSMESAVEDIEARMGPINDILRHLPFGANCDRLRIKLRRLTTDRVSTFRRELRAVSSGATKELTDDQLEGRLKQLQAFMAQIRDRDDPRGNPALSDRDRLLDVRRHVEITAERFSPEGVLLSTHSALGGKSGGESQELVAFIVGAALRFRLGDDENARPTFAPVFLDEGFVKSDAEFAGRAVQAWKGLGFQLIVGAPLDKVTALEPHMDEFLAITKDTATHYSFVHRLKDAPAPAETA